MISDGRPYDRDYGRDAEDRDYAVQDTRQALLEAKRRKIRPFCLTIDREGEDYLRQMCDEIPYEVVTKVEGVADPLNCRLPETHGIRLKVRHLMRSPHPDPLPQAGEGDLVWLMLRFGPLEANKKFSLSTTSSWGRGPG